MRKFFTALLATASLAACASSPEPMIPTEGAVQRTVERIVGRHDAYVLNDDALPEDVAAEALEQSMAVRTMMVLPEVSSGVLGFVLEPVMDRHDAYVLADPALANDELARGSYLASTERMRSLLEATAAPVPAR